MVRLRKVWRRFAGWLISPGIVAILLGVAGILIVVSGAVYHHCECQGWWNLVAGWEPEFEALYANFATTLIGIAIAVFTIDRANERRAEQQLKAQLIREMGGSDNGIARRAVRELEAHKWLYDGSLHRAHLREANLHEVNLRGAVLRGAVLRGAKLERANLRGAKLEEVNLFVARLQGTNLRGANLRGANLLGADLQGANLREANLYGTDLNGANLQAAYLNETNLQNAYLQDTKLREAHLFGANLDGVRGLTDRQLVTVSHLQSATMSNGIRYNGCFNLSVDIEAAKRENITTADPAAMAHFYGVTLEEYLAGQEWARENLSRLRREAGLEQAEEPQMVAPQHGSSSLVVTPPKNLREFTIHRLVTTFWR